MFNIPTFADNLSNNPNDQQKNIFSFGANVQIPPATIARVALLAFAIIATFFLMLIIYKRKIS